MSRDGNLAVWNDNWELTLSYWYYFYLDCMNLIVGTL